VANHGRLLAPTFTGKAICGSLPGSLLIVAGILMLTAIQARYERDSIARDLRNGTTTTRAT
jgi:hypothetical protein